MAKTIIVCGYGRGISQAVANKFGAEGFSVALAARNAANLDEGVRALEAKGFKAAAFPTDLADAKAVKALVANARERLGPIAAIHYNPYGGGGGDLLKAEPNDFHAIIDINVAGLVTAVQAAHDDLKSQKGAVLVTGGGFCFYDPKIDAMAAQWNAMGIAIGKAAQHKTVGLLTEKLRPDHVFVGEVIVMGMVKGTAFDTGAATLEPSRIADKFWELFQERNANSVTIE